MDDEQNIESKDNIDESVTTFLNVGCRCSAGPDGEPCSKSFSK